MSGTRVWARDEVCASAEMHLCNVLQRAVRAGHGHCTLRLLRPGRRHGAACARSSAGDDAHETTKLGTVSCSCGTCDVLQNAVRRVPVATREHRSPRPSRPKASTGACGRLAMVAMRRRRAVFIDHRCSSVVHLASTRAGSSLCEGVVKGATTEPPHSLLYYFTLCFSD
jgi:hypothetical protein